MLLLIYEFHQKKNIKYTHTHTKIKTFQKTYTKCTCQVNVQGYKKLTYNIKPKYRHHTAFSINKCHFIRRFQLLPSNGTPNEPLVRIKLKNSQLKIRKLFMLKGSIPKCLRDKNLKIF